MPKKPVSVTLEEANLLWLKGRTTGRKKRSLSDALDEVVSEARRGGHGGDAPRSVVGTIDVATDDLELSRADDAVRALFAESLSRPLLVREGSPTFTSNPRPAAKRRKRSRG